jgi:hypothetical protein
VATLNGFSTDAIENVGRLLFKQKALELALSEARARAEGSNCQAFFYKAVVASLAEQVGNVKASIRGIVGRQELLSVGRDPDEFPIFVENRR